MPPPPPPSIVEVLVDIGLEISGVIFVVDAITKSVAVFVGWITMTLVVLFVGVVEGAVGVVVVVEDGWIITMFVVTVVAVVVGAAVAGVVTVAIKRKKNI